MRRLAVMAACVTVFATATAEDQAPAAASRQAAPAGNVAAVRKPGTMDRLELGTTSITGNRELPKVMYVVPWKRADVADAGRPLNSLIEEILAPVDREVFGREVGYFKALAQAPKADAETSVTAGARAP